MALDGVDIGGNFGEDRRRIAGTSTDFEHLFAAAQRQRLGHERDDIGLRNRLSFFDWQRRIVIGKFMQSLRQELLTRHGAHGIEHELGAHTSCENCPVDHLVTKLRVILVRVWVRGLTLWHATNIGEPASASLTKINCVRGCHDTKHFGAMSLLRIDKPATEFPGSSDGRPGRMAAG